ncbi:MAG: transcriptional regulator [halophilic archaeon J07HX64]|jgi:transcriptional regulator, AsnC family|nr:MAG: transcriptional regulator [halophilic archaeon J07HX64]
MRGLDDTDREILRILTADGRRSYSDIAEQVELSPPAVSDRVDRLQELGVIRRFTVDIDRDLLREGTGALVTVRANPGAGEQVRDRLADTDHVESLFLTADETVVCTVVAEDVRAFLADRLPANAVTGYDVQLLADSTWIPRLGEPELAPECVECGNSVGGDGERERLDDDIYHFCCSSCRDAFLDRYERLSEGV